MAYFENESLTGVKNGVNTTFTLANGAIEIDNVLWKNTQILDFQFSQPSTITLNAPPQAGDALTASYWTSGSLIGSSSPYELPSTLESLKTRVRILLGEQFSEEWNDTSITDWLNEGINVICTKADFPFMEAEASVFTVPDQQSYQLPAGFKQIIKIYYRQDLGSDAQTNSSNLPMGMVFRDSPEDLTNPPWFPLTGYTLFGETFVLAEQTQALEVRIRYYRYLPYFDNNTPAQRNKIPRQYEDMLIDYAVMRGRQQEEIYDIAQLHEKKFNSRLDDMIVDQKRRVMGEYPAIRANPYLY